MTELLLIIGVLAGIVALGLLVLAGIRLATAYFVLPVEPPCLVRLRKLLEPLLLEQEAAEADARRRYPPPPEIATALRAIAGFGGYPGRREGSWATRPIGE